MCFAERVQGACLLVPVVIVGLNFNREVLDVTDYIADDTENNT